MLKRIGIVLALMCCVSACTERGEIAQSVQDNIEAKIDDLYMVDINRRTITVETVNAAASKYINSVESAKSDTLKLDALFITCTDMPVIKKASDHSKAMKQITIIKNKEYWTDERGNGSDELEKYVDAHKIQLWATFLRSDGALYTWPLEEKCDEEIEDKLRMSIFKINYANGTSEYKVLSDGLIGDEFTQHILNNLKTMNRWQSKSL